MKAHRGGGGGGGEPAKICDWGHGALRLADEREKFFPPSLARLDE